MFVNVLVLLIKCYQLFRNYVGDATHHNSFGLLLTATNEFCKHAEHCFH